MKFKTFQTTERDVDLILNDEGKRAIDSIVKEYANFSIDNEDQYYSLTSSDVGFQDDGSMKLELASSQTISGEPVTYELDFEEHFDATFSD